MNTHVPRPDIQTLEIIPPPSTAEQEQLQLVRQYDSGEGLTFASNGDAKGVTCMIDDEWALDLGGEAPEEKAMWLLKLEVVRSGGNAVLSPECVHHPHVDWANDCWESWECNGQAIRVY